MQLEELIPFDLDVLDAVELVINFDACTRFVELPILRFTNNGYVYQKLIYDRVTGTIALDLKDVTYLKEYLQ